MEEGRGEGRGEREGMSEGWRRGAMREGDGGRMREGREVRTSDAGNAQSCEPSVEPTVFVS